MYPDAAGEPIIVGQNMLCDGWYPRSERSAVRLDSIMSSPLTRDWLEARDRIAEVTTFRDRYGEFGLVERRSFPFQLATAKRAGTPESGRNDGSLQVIGHAAVFGKPSVEMNSPFGTFTEYMDPSAFNNVLSRGGDVLLTWDHDSRWILGRTGNNTLELSVDPTGLRYWSRIADVSYARDLATLMEGGYLNQSSFLFRIAKGGEEWSFTEDPEGHEIVTRTIYEVGELYDVCVCAAGAYPDTDSGLMRTLALDYAARSRYISVPENFDPAVAPQEKRSGREKRLATAEEMRALGDVAWGPEDGFNDLACDIEELLNGGQYGEWCVIDVAVDSTKCIAINWNDYSYWCIPFTVGRDKEPTLSEQSEWLCVESAWVITIAGYEANMRSATQRREARLAEAETAVETPEVETPEDEKPEDEETPEETPDEEPETPEDEETPADEDAAEQERARALRLRTEAQIRLARTKGL